MSSAAPVGNLSAAAPVAQATPAAAPTKQTSATVLAGTGKSTITAPKTEQQTLEARSDALTSKLSSERTALKGLVAAENKAIETRDKDYDISGHKNTAYDKFFAREGGVVISNHSNVFIADDKATTDKTFWTNASVNSAYQEAKDIVADILKTDQDAVDEATQAVAVKKGEIAALESDMVAVTVQLTNLTLDKVKAAKAATAQIKADKAAAAPETKAKPAEEEAAEEGFIWGTLCYIPRVLCSAIATGFTWFTSLIGKCFGYGNGKSEETQA